MAVFVSRSFLKQAAISVVPFVLILHGCCGRLPVPQDIPESWCGTVWRLIISHDGQGLFEGLLVCGNAVQPEGSSLFSCSLIDSTGITLMTLIRNGTEFAVKKALPPFDEKRISNYIEEDLAVLLCCALDHYHAHGVCSVEEYPCGQDCGGRTDMRCTRGRSGPFESWVVRSYFESAAGLPSEFEEAVITRWWSGMEMRIQRFE